MSERYPGGYITKSPPTPTFQSAPGIWTLDQAMQYIKEGNWPIANEGYLMMMGLGNTGALGQSLNAGVTPIADTSNFQTVYYGPWNTGGGGTPCMLVKDDGTLWGMGKNNNGQIGINQTSPTGADYRWVPLPYQVGLATDWLNAKIVSRSESVVAIKSNGTLWAWGNNQYGKLGLSSVDSKSSPVQVGALTDWAKISLSASHCLAIKTDGTLWGWGLNSNGELGLNNRNAYSSPVQIGALTTWAEVSVGSSYSVLIQTDGTMWSCGDNSSGTLGLNLASTAKRSSPVQIGALTTWSKAFAGASRCFAISTTGALWAWGTNTGGALGLGNALNRSSPVQVGALTNWSLIEPDYPRAIKTDGTLWAWGQSGNPFASSSAALSSPVQVGSDTDWNSFAGSLENNYFDGKGTNTNPSLLIFKTNKSYPYASSKVNATFPYFTPVPGATWPVLMDSGRWTSTSIMLYQASGVKNNGTLWMWGNNNNGQLGQNDRVNRSSPVQVGSSTDWKSIFIASGLSVYAINSSNALYAWGVNTAGALGLNDRVNRSSPVQVGALTNWKQVTGGSTNNFAVAVKTDGTLWAWGANNAGSLGLNLASTANRSSPVQVGSLTDWDYVSSGNEAVLAIKTDGTLWAWGQNAQRQLGTGGVTDNRSSPVQIGALTNWKKVSVGESHTLALKTDGTLWAWGANNRGQLGNGLAATVTSPIQIGSNTNWLDIGAGAEISYGITTSGTLYVWGWISRANIGASPLTGYTEFVYRSSPVQVGAKNYYKAVFVNDYNFNAAFLTNAT